MTYEETKKIMISAMCRVNDMPPSVVEAFRMYQDTFEKQIPKPKHRYAGIRCVCGEVVARYQDYCEYCGQRLLPYEGD